MVPCFSSQMVELFHLLNPLDPPTTFRVETLYGGKPLLQHPSIILPFHQRRKAIPLSKNPAIEV